MKLLPEVPTQEMLDEMSRWEPYSDKVLSLVYKLAYDAAPEVKDEPVAWTSEEELERGKRKKQSIVAWTEDYDDYPVALYLRPSPRIAELEDALRDMLSGWKYIREVHGDLYGVGWDRAQKKAEEALK